MFLKNDSIVSRRSGQGGACVTIAFRRDGVYVKIRDIEVVTLRFEYPRGGGFRYAGGYCTGRASSLVWVHTDEGISGLGSVYSHPDLVRVIVEGQLAPMLRGHDPLQVEAIWEQNYKLTR